MERRLSYKILLRQISNFIILEIIKTYELFNNIVPVIELNYCVG